MPNVKNIKPPTKKRVEGFIYNMERKMFHEKEIKAAEIEREKRHRIKYTRFVNGVEVVSYHQPVKH